ncbi:MAG: hypothetical protein RLZZ50_425, partial [Verrucomicrobiota bacterium]
MAQVITMPKLSDTMTVGTLVKWLRKEGDAVKFGDLLAEIETDKATMEFESFADGTILKLYATAGSQVAIGDPLCAVGAPGEAAPAAAPAPSSTPAAASSQTPPPATTANPAEAAPAAVPAAPQSEISNPKSQMPPPAAPAAPVRAAG